MTDGASAAEIFDRRLRRIRRDRAAAAPAERRFLHAHVAGELLDRLGLVTRDFSRALDLGCADGTIAQALAARGTRTVSADWGFGFARAAGGVQCDEDRLPFADGSFDLVVSASGLESVNDLPGALALVRRVLKPDGLFLAGFVGAGSLSGLRAAMLAGDLVADGGASPRLHPQIDVRAAGDLLARAGFALPVADGDRLTIRYSSLAGVLGDLRAGGCGNLLLSRGRAPDRLAFAAAHADFLSRADAGGRVAETIALVTLIGWAPGPDQPTPARRGSGTASLADALRRTPRGDS